MNPKEGNVVVWAFKKAELLPLGYHGPVTQLGKTNQYFLIDLLTLPANVENLVSS
jgi:hypothetical protein